MSRRMLVIGIMVAVLVIVWYLLVPAPTETPPANHATPPGAGANSTPAMDPLPAPKRLLTVGFSFAKPPYVACDQFADVDLNSSSHSPLGFEVDIFQAAISRAGYTFKPSFQPFARVVSDLAEGRLDAAESSGAPQPGIFYSQPIINCQNFAITRKSDNHHLMSVQDLTDLRMVAWQNASTDLGPAFTAVTRNNPKYFENVNQQAQYQMFADHKVDALIIDKYIFQWWQAQHAKAKGHIEEVTYHPIFPGVNPYFIGFRDRSIRDAFDAQLIKLRESGEFDRIIAQYIPDQVSAASVGKAVVVRFGTARPPFVMDQERRGISVDLAGEAFRRMNLMVNPLFASNLRLESELAAGTAQIAIEVQRFSTELHFSDPFMTYHNVVATRSSMKRSILQWSDLNGLRVCVWQNAQQSIGALFAEAVPGFGKYAEFPDQREQVLEWALGHFDAAIIDRDILRWNLRTLSKDIPNLPAMSDLTLDPTPTGTSLDWYAGFRSVELRDQFNLALKAIRQDGTYDRIFARYLPLSTEHK